MNMHFDQTEQKQGTTLDTTVQGTPFHAQLQNDHNGTLAIQAGLRDGGAIPGNFPNVDLQVGIGNLNEYRQFHGTIMADGSHGHLGGGSPVSPAERDFPDGSGGLADHPSWRRFMSGALDPAQQAERQGFDQTSPHEQGIWSEVKGIFSHRDTVGDDLAKKVREGMSPADQKELDRELKQQKQDWLRDATMMDISYKPEHRDYPMIDKYNEMIRQEQNQISQQVLAGMSPEDLKALQHQEHEYYKPQPIRLDGPLVEPQRQPGPMLQEYWRRLSEATEKHCQS